MEIDPPPHQRTVWFLTAAMVVLGPLAVLKGAVGFVVTPGDLPGTTLGGLWEVLETAIRTLVGFPDQVRIHGVLDALETLDGLLPLAVLLVALRATLALGEDVGSGGDDAWNWAVTTHAAVLLLGANPVYASTGTVAIMALAGWALYLLLRARLVEARV